VAVQDLDDQGFAPLPLVNRRSSGDLVAVHIRSMIFDGELRQGDRMRQDDIARRLGVSRIPVREAIIALDREGWLTITPHRGAFVHGLDEDALRDHYELLGLVYGLAARRATERASDDDLVRLQDAQKQLSSADSPTTMHDANDEFLRTLLAVARSPRLGSVMRNMSTVVPGNFFELIEGSGPVQKRGTKRIVAAIKREDPDAAADACMRLLRDQGGLVIKLLSSRGMFSARTRSSSTPSSRRISSVCSANCGARRSTVGVSSNCTGLVTSSRVAPSTSVISAMRPFARTWGSRPSSTVSCTGAHWPSSVRKRSTQ
jgi:DNA-binding GntR family transcriptional regulator